MSLQCPICVGSAFDPVGRVPFMLGSKMHEHQIMGCRTCGHVMVDLRVITEELIADLYARPLDEQVWSTDGSSPYEDMVAFAADALETVRKTQQSPRIADFGYGCGEVLKALHQRFDVPREQLTGYDFAPLPLEGISTKTLRLDVLDEHAEQDAQFDLGFCSHVFEHIIDPRRLLRGLRNQARPGAYLYLETPDHSLLNDEVLSMSNQICPQHLHYFTVDRLAALARSCGWTVMREEVSLFGFVPRARLLLHREGGRDAIGCTRRFLTFRADLNARLSQTLLRLSESGPVAAWGAGTDLLLATAGDTVLAERVGAGRIIPHDRERAGERLAGALIQSSDLLSAASIPVVITPRPALTRLNMMKIAGKSGFAARVVDPYLS